MAVKRRGDFPRRLPPVFDDNLRRGQRKFALHRQCRRTRRERFRRIGVPVVFAARKADEDVPLHHVLAVRCDACNLPVFEAGYSFVRNSFD